jgi:hypothetical protein
MDNVEDKMIVEKLKKHIDEGFENMAKVFKAYFGDGKLNELRLCITEMASVTNDLSKAIREISIEREDDNEKLKNARQTIILLENRIVELKKMVKKE